MRVTRLFEDPGHAERFDGLRQSQFVELLAKHKVLLVQSDDGSDPLTVEDFARFAEGLQLQHYEYVGGAGKD